MIAALEVGHGAIALRREAGPQVVPGVGGVREAVDQQHQRPLALLEVGEAYAVGLDVLELRAHGCAS